MEFVAREQKRLQNIIEVGDRYIADRIKEMDRHDTLTKSMEKDRLDTQSWAEKNDLAAKLIEHAKYDPRKYLLEYVCQESPYFGILGIKDDDPKIGDKEYLIGKQSLTDGHKVVVVDWRKAEISRLYFEYTEEGDTYDEEIQGRDRTGEITKRHPVMIEKKTLRGIKTTDDVYELRGEYWYRNGELISPVGEGAPAVAGEVPFIEMSRIAKPEDHSLPDIISLISPEQFRIIAQQSEGCVRLTGGAGSGKTTVGLSRLSFLRYNEPEKFREDRCMVMMFNRSLCDYIKSTSEDLLGKIKVETFFVWALQALRRFGCTIDVASLETVSARQDSPDGYHGALVAYANNAPQQANPIDDLFAFYADPGTAELYSPKKREAFLASLENKKLAFADIGSLLRLCQLRSKQEIVEGALGWYDHILIDETQDFGLVELICLLAATNKSRSLTICDDESQKILTFINDRDFAVFIEQLRTLGLDKKTLTVSYRCPPEIMVLASQISGRPVEVSDNKNGGTGVIKYHKVIDRAEGYKKLVEVVSALVKNDPLSLTAVICKRKTDVPHIRKALAELEALHPAGPMQFKPGVLVTNAHQTKGLEFNHVVLWNPTVEDFRNTKTDRNLLYVATTRTSRTLDLIYDKELAKGLAHA